MVVCDGADVDDDDDNDDAVVAALAAGVVEPNAGVDVETWVDVEEEEDVLSVGEAEEEGLPVAGY